MTDVTQSAAISYSAMVQPYMPVFYVSFLVTIILTPLMRTLAHRHGVVDDPDNKRKVHSTPIAYLGGVSIFLGWLAGISVSVFLHPHNNPMTTVQMPPGVIMGAIVVVLFGLMDDVYQLSPKMKLGGQFLAAVLLVLPGVVPLFGSTDTDFVLRGGNGPAWMIILDLVNLGYVRGISQPADLPHWVHMAAPLFSGGLAIFIILATCNATNLLDGLDGLCSGVTGIISVGYLVLAVTLAGMNMTSTDVANATELDPVRISLALALLGAVLGFLPFNFNPASIFMGDTGSMFLGFVSGAMMLLFAQDKALRWFLAAIAMFGLPLMDTLLAIVRRKLNGKPIFAPDSNHFHHFLVKRGLTVRQAVLIGYGVAAVFVSFGVLGVVMQTRLVLGIYLVLFGWMLVVAFKMGMIFQNAPVVSSNTKLNLSVVTGKADKALAMAEKKDAPEEAGVGGSSKF
jgi:UDP-GlcNAc:undecaprenyl-phosphate/decaprenyl-phosphate GlcNAc-1-phosphate transferase